MSRCSAEVVVAPDDIPYGGLTNYPRCFLDLLLQWSFSMPELWEHKREGGQRAAHHPSHAASHVAHLQHAAATRERTILMNTHFLRSPGWEVGDGKETM